MLSSSSSSESICKSKSKETYRKKYLRFCLLYGRRSKCSALALLTLILIASLLATFTSASSWTWKEKIQLSPWQPGYLDIHHLRVGPSVCSFFILPDGTTWMVDAGDIDLPRTLAKLHRRKEHQDLEILHPSPGHSTAGWILEYVNAFWPRPQESMADRTLDYILNTHFHVDHLGEPGPDSPNSKSGNFKLTGLTEVGDQMRIETLIDRGYPNYDFPIDLRSEWPSGSLHNYLLFTKENMQSNGMKMEAFQVGSKSQFRMKRNQTSIAAAAAATGNFVVHNLKSNLDVVDKDGRVSKIRGEVFLNKKKRKWDENEMSTAFVLDYGDFRYYEGGDVEQHSNEEGSLDTITPTATAAGLVDVATANHHGRGTNQAFCDLLDPEVVIVQGLFSDQPLNETVRLLSKPRANDGKARLILITDVFKKRLKALGSLSHSISAKNGHVVVRVSPPTDGSAAQTYEVFLLNEQRRYIEQRFGPFYPHKK